MPEKDDLMDEEFGDLLADAAPARPEPTPKAAPVKRQAPVQPQAPRPTPAPAARPSPAPAASKKNPFETVPFGTKVATVPIPRFKATKAAKSRIAFLSSKVLPIKTHYVNGIGSFVCFEGKCCELEGLPKVRYLLPIVVYETDKNAKVISENISVQALCLGDDAYSALSDAISFSGKDLKDIDVIISCTDENYQKLSFTVVGNDHPSWGTFTGAKDVIEYYKANRDRLYMAVARTLEEATYLSKKGFVTPTSQAPQVDNPEDLLDE